MAKRKSPWSAVDKDQLGYESNFNETGQFHDGPRTVDNDKLLTEEELQNPQADNLP
ncbi:MAG TPA: hypothetical protein PKA10_04755 [Selenomonadales bacterium]|nr:hypothetical protein [Selenomonadales bacterium]